MSDLNQETIKQLSSLCRIHFTEEKETALLNDLKKILDYIELLKEIDTENVPPCNHVLDDIYNVLREDTVGELLNRDHFLSNSPAHVGGLIKVPPVMKSN